jgi:hypothetical protein
MNAAASNNAVGQLTWGNDDALLTGKCHFARQVAIDKILSVQ